MQVTDKNGNIFGPNGVQINGADGKPKTTGGSGGGAAWGGITGTLSSQTDLNSALNGKEPSITAGTTSQYYRGDKTFQTLDKSAVGLGNVDNTSDANKPVSTATSTALGLKQDTLVSGTNIKTVNGSSLLGSGDVSITASATWGGITGTLSSQTDLQTALNAKQNNPILFCSSAVTVVTGTTTETLIASVPIPTTISNAMLRSSFTVRVTTLGAAAPRTRIRIGTFASPTTAQITASTILATNAIGSTGMVSIYRTMPVIGGALGSIKAFATGSNANADYGQLAAFDVVLKNFTTQQYLYFTINNNTLTAVTESYGVLVENIQ